VWRLNDAAPVGEPLRHRGPVRAVAAAALPDGTPVIISGCDDHFGPSTVLVWRAADATQVVPPLHLGKSVEAVAIHGNVIIGGGGGDGTVRMWRTADGTPIGEPMRHGRPVYAVAVGALPDGTPVIVSGGGDGTVRVWRTADGTQVVPSLDLTGSVRAVAVHGDVIITAAGADIAVHQPALPRPTR
jgi:WD40 repeat protein